MYTVSIALVFINSNLNSCSASSSPVKTDSTLSQYSLWFSGSGHLFSLINLGCKSDIYRGFVKIRLYSRRFVRVFWVLCENEFVDECEQNLSNPCFGKYFGVNCEMNCVDIGCEESANDVFRGIPDGCDLDVRQVIVR